MSIKSYIIIMLIFWFPIINAQDSIVINQLEELTVVGKKYWIEDNIVNYIPTKKEKQLSDSPESLIKSIHLPMLRIKDGNIVNISGEPVSIFINGDLATETDIATFWPKDVKKVQYLENPDNPIFEGKRYVVNFITNRYSVGGVTKLKLYENIPTNGIYNLSSKATYKKMTYGITANYIHMRDHRTKNFTETEYRDIYYNGNFYDIIKNYQKEKNYDKSNYAGCSFNAKYSSSKLLITHTISTTYEHNPYSKNIGTDNWTYNLFNSSNSWNAHKDKKLSPQISGHYVYCFNPKWYLTGKWFYIYSLNNSQIWNQTGEATIVYNQYKENVNSCKFLLLPTFLCSSKFSVQMMLSASLNWFKSHYRGSVESTSNISTQNFISSVKLYWIPSRKFYVTLEPGLTGDFKQIGEIKNTSLIPTFKASLALNPDNRLNINLNMRHYTTPPSASESNPVLVRVSELMWLKGNPHLKNKRLWEIDFSATHFANDWLSITYGFGYYHSSNNIVSSYTNGNKEAEGIVQQMINAHPMSNLRGDVSFQFSIFDDNLSFGVTPNWNLYTCRAGHFKTLNWLSLSGEFDYTIKNFRISAEYDGPYKDIDTNGMQKTWIQDSWNAAIVYGNGNVYVEGRLTNIFNHRAKSRMELVSPNYTSSINKLQIGRRISISLTYTFGYGKKTDRQIDIDSPETTETSILKIR